MPYIKASLTDCDVYTLRIPIYCHRTLSCHGKSNVEKDASNFWDRCNASGVAWFILLPMIFIRTAGKDLIAQFYPDTSFSRAKEHILLCKDLCPVPRVLFFIQKYLTRSSVSQRVRELSEGFSPERMFKFPAERRRSESD